jgi:hypothetical protein
MSESYSLPTEPEGMVATLLERFNSGKVSVMMSPARRGWTLAVPDRQ